MKKYIIIEADVNDGDYIHSRNIITDDELELIKPVIQAIKDYNDDETIKHQKWNWYTIDNREPNPMELYKGKFSEEAYDFFNSILPYMDNESIHTIESIDILIVAEEIKLL